MFGIVLAAGTAWWLIHREQTQRQRERRRVQRRTRGRDRMVLPSSIYRRPDPLIYSQRALLALGLDVTWDNPDIHLEGDGEIVAADALDPDTEYTVVARLWNSSTDAAVFSMPVRFSYLDFGIGGASMPIGESWVSISVKGGSKCPAFARHSWRTPAAAGHYCLQVELIWPDDANPANNLGQHNILVRKLNSPRVGVHLPVRNTHQRQLRCIIESDAYVIGPLQDCPPQRAASAEQSAAERQWRFAELRARHGRGQAPLPQDWSVKVEPSEFVLGPGEERLVDVDILAPNGFSGRKAINLTAVAGSELVGGVTMYVET